MSNGATRVLAVASAGGHWEQLMLLRQTLDNYDVRFATTRSDLSEVYDIPVIDTLPDCNQNTPLRALACAVLAMRLVIRHRPQVVVSTGAAPGFFSLLAGRIAGARTLWIDSIANSEGLSLSGRLAKIVAHQCWTQWEHLARDGRPAYHGAML